MNSNILTIFFFKSYIGISQSKKTLSNLVIAPKCSTFITLFSTVTTFCTDTPVQAKYCTLGTGKGFQLPTIFLVIVVVFVLKLKRQHVDFCCFLTVSQNCGSLSSKCIVFKIAANWEYGIYFHSPFCNFWQVFGSFFVCNSASF